MILRKYYDGEDILGLKVNGGQPLGAGIGGGGGGGIGGPCGAIVEKVKRGSVADLEGRIRPGNHHYSSHFSLTTFTSYVFFLDSFSLFLPAYL